MTKTLGLALGSGGARGWAHIGVIKTLLQAGIPINFVAGTSIGAFVGGAFAAGELDTLDAFVRQLDWKMMLSFFDLVFPKQGLLDGNKIYALLNEQLCALKIEEGIVPFCCVATDLLTGAEVRLNSGLFADAIRASISMPGVFTPLHQPPYYLADGGIVNPVPVNVVRAMGADLVVAINLNHSYSEPQILAASPQIVPESSEPGLPFWANIQDHYKNLSEGINSKLEQWLPPVTKVEAVEINIFDIIGTTINIMEQKVTRLNLELDSPDLLLQPNLSNVGIFDFDLAHQVIAEGVRVTEPLIPEIQALLAD
ncbi:MAG: patatin-like phospholipase family protein [Pseudanabaenaceae cyanobacterium bins.68]|nr:patatin-like phospholipase family protein [Pseudanabaenaceae cyanobacterium bins.68]